VNKNGALLSRDSLNLMGQRHPFIPFMVFLHQINSSYWQNSQDWMLNHHFQIQSSPENYFCQPTQGETDDQQHSG
jgi:hypothetical protein